MGETRSICRTERLYYDYTGAAPFGAEILECRPAADGNIQILLDKTIFYPEGGGQPGDRGTINGISLLDVREKDGEIFHLVSSEDGLKLKPGPAELILDSRRRRDHTVLHTGQHLLSGTILSKIGAPTVSMHMGDETCTIDVDTKAEINDEVLAGIEETMAGVIEENRPVTIHLCPPEDISSFPLRKRPPQGEDVIRIVEISGCDIIACCGTHLKSTAEIGLFRIFGAEKYKGMCRISFLAGRRLLRDCRLLRQNAGIISRALSVPLSETGKGVLDLLEKTAQTEKRLRALEEKSVLAQAEALCRKAAACEAGAAGAAGAASKGSGSSGPAMLVETYADADINVVMSIGKAAQKQTQALLVLVSEQDLKFAAFCRTQGFDLRPAIKAALEAHNGRGGGSASFFQGSFAAKESLDGFLREIQKQASGPV